MDLFYIGSLALREYDSGLQRILGLFRDFVSTLVYRTCDAKLHSYDDVTKRHWQNEKPLQINPKSIHVVLD